MKENLANLDPMTWLVLGSAALICGLVLFVKTIKITLKLAVILVMLATACYFLREAGVL